MTKASIQNFHYFSYLDEENRGGGKLTYTEAKKLYMKGRERVWVLHDEKNQTISLCLVNLTNISKEFGWDKIEILFFNKTLNRRYFFGYVATSRDNPKMYFLNTARSTQYNAFQELHGKCLMYNFNKAKYNKDGAIIGWLYPDEVQIETSIYEKGEALKDEVRKYSILNEKNKLWTQVPNFGEWDHIIEHCKKIPTILEKINEEF